MKFGVALFFCLWAVAVIVCEPARAAEKTFLGDRHVKEFGLECAGCHLENPPSKDVKMETCINCHGDLMEVGKNTELKELPNPHVNHNEELYCEDCHKGHKASVNFCNECHDFNYNIP